MFHVYWPVTACLTLVVVVGTIIVLLRFGPKLCKTRHVALDNERDWEKKAYEQRVSYA